MRVLVAGWRLSLVDVESSVTVTVWFCGCNLRCPFCHNWGVAERRGCEWVDAGELAGELNAAARLVDFVHVTGGEPLLQWEALLELAKLLDAPLSVDTNATLVGPLRRLLSSGAVEHVATDLKHPFELVTGLPPAAAARLHSHWHESMRLLGAAGVRVELRIPVPRWEPFSEWLGGMRRELERALGELRGADAYILLYPLLGPPWTKPRSPGWCARHCNPPARMIVEALEEARRVAGEYGVEARLSHTARTVLHHTSAKQLGGAQPRSSSATPWLSQLRLQ